MHVEVLQKVLGNKESPTEMADFQSLVIRRGSTVFRLGNTK